MVKLSALYMGQSSLATNAVTLKTLQTPQKTLPTPGNNKMMTPGNGFTKEFTKDQTLTQCLKTNGTMNSLDMSSPDMTKEDYAPSQDITQMNCARLAIQ